jgi:hypothetical protein
MIRSKLDETREGIANIEDRQLASVRERMDRALHDLCQPLTTLQCRLEVAQTIGSPEACREAVDLGMLECVQLYAAVDILRDILSPSSQKGTGESTTNS